jgi:hypothetical protein
VPARAYLTALDLRTTPQLQLARDWRETEKSTRDTAWDSSWWVKEDAERQALTREIASRVGEAAMLEALTAAVGDCTEPTFAAALAAAGGDEALARVASGAALMAVHGRALALLAGRGGAHLFVQKYALFARGRWPLGLRGPETFLIF